MSNIQLEAKQSFVKKSTDQFCGRLIVWDMGTPQQDVIILASEYSDAKPDLSSQNQPKPAVPRVSDTKTSKRAVAAINKVIELYDLRYSSSEEPDYLCGRLITWDVGTPREKFIHLETNYHPPKYKPSSDIELKPYVYAPKAPKSSASKPIAERYRARHGLDHEDLP